jgi:hypothetical protein
MARGRILLGIGLCAAVVVSGAAVVTGPVEKAEAAETVSFTDRAYRPLSPARVLDTRGGAGAVGAGSSIAVRVTGVGGVPAEGVGAVVLNLTGTQPSADTYVTAYPDGEARPTASNLNLRRGQTAPNLVIAKVGTGGNVRLYNNAGTVHLIADVMGWFVAGSEYSSLNPARLLDTRGGAGPVGARSSIAVRVTGVGGVPSEGVGAVVLNVTGTQPSADTFVTAYPEGESRPTASNLNLQRGQTAPNLVIAKVGVDGKVRLYNNAGSVHLVADVMGWIALGGDYAPEVPARILDTRGGAGPVGARSSIAVRVTGVGGVPSEGVGAVVLNVTGTQPSADTFVTAYPEGESRPTASNLNLQRGQTAPNLVIAKVGVDGKVRLYNNAGTVHLIADVMGWISVGVEGDVTKPDSTEVVEPADVTEISTETGDLTVSGAAPAVGEHVFVPPGAGTGEGLLGKVTGATPRPDGTTELSTEPARLEEAFPSGEVHGSVDSRALAAGSPLAPSIAGRLRADENGVFAVSARAANVDCDGAPLAYDVDLSVEARFVIDVRWGVGTVHELRLVFELEIGSTVTFTVGGTASCEIALPPAIHLPPVWGFVPTLQPVMKLDFSGGLTVTREVAGGVTVGANYRDGSMRWIRDGYLTGTQSAPEVAAEASAKVTFGPKASVKFAGRLGASLFGGLFAETEVSTTGDPWWSVDGGVEVSVALEANLWFANFSYTLATVVFGRIRLAAATGPWPGPRFTSRSLPTGEVGLAYNAAVPVTGTAPLTVRLIGGTLPAGLALSGGRISGTPTTPSYRTVTVQATDGQGRTAQNTLSVSVVGAGESNELPLPGSPEAHEFALSTYWMPQIFGPGPRGEALLCGWEQTASGLMERARFVARDGSVATATPALCENRPRQEYWWFTTLGDSIWGADGWTYELANTAKEVRGYGPDGALRWTWPFTHTAATINLTPDRKQLVVTGDYFTARALDPHTGDFLYSFPSSQFSYVSATDAYFIMPNGTSSYVDIDYVYRGSGQVAARESLPPGFGVRPADGTAVLAARTFDHSWSGDTETKPCGSGVYCVTAGGIAWQVTVPAAYAECSFQSVYATGDGGGYLVQVRDNEASFRVTRVNPGGTVGWSSEVPLSGGRIAAGSDGGGGDELVFADASGRIAYVTEHPYSCTSGGAAATCLRTRLTVRGPDGAVLATRTYEQAGYRVFTYSAVGGFGQIFLAMHYGPAGTQTVERSTLVSTLVPFDGDWDFTRQYRSQPG